MPRKKKKASYGDYCVTIDGKLYASVYLPLGGGKYKRKRKLVETKTDARNWALEQLKLHRTGGAPEEVKTFADLAEWYKDEFLVEPTYKDGKKLFGVRTYKTQRRMADRLKEEFGFFQLDDLNVDVLRRYKRERLKKVSITAVNREFALLRSMFKKARSRRWMRENPFDLGENLIEIALEGRRKNPLTDRIARRLLARARKSEQPLLFYLVLVAASTGARPSELMPYDAYDDSPRAPLCWKNILDFDFKAVRLISYKGRVAQERIVPATDYLEKALRKWYAEISPAPDDLLFPVKNFKRSWKTLTKSVRCEGVRLRDFRGYFNTKMLNAQFDEVTRLLVLGHSNVKTNLRYSFITEEFINNFRENFK